MQELLSPGDAPESLKALLDSICLEHQAAQESVERCLEIISGISLVHINISKSLTKLKRLENETEIGAISKSEAKTAAFEPQVEAPDQKAATSREHAHEVVSRQSRIGSMLKSLNSEARKPPTDARHIHCGHGSFPFLQYAALAACRSRFFEPVFGVLILINSIVMGIEAELSLHADATDTLMTYEAIEWVFSACFCVELLIRLTAHGWASFRDTWFCLDFCLVVTTVASTVTTLALRLSAFAEMLQLGLLLRSFRLLRFIKALRTLKIGVFRKSWRLVYGLLTSGTTLASTVLLLAVTLYLFAILGIELITKDSTLVMSPLAAEIVAHSFNSVPATLLTLVQFVTLDSVAGIYVPLITVQPALSIYFLSLILVVSISLMNAITAILVDATIAQGENDRSLEHQMAKERLKAAMPKVTELFQKLDTYESGSISLEQVKHCPLDVLPQEIGDKITVGNMTELFEMLDVDNSGELSQDEFIGGLLNVFLFDMPISSIQTLQLCRMIRSKVIGLEHDCTFLKHQIDETRSTVHGMAASRSTPAEYKRAAL